MSVAKDGAATWKSDMMLALLATLVALAMDAAGGFSGLFDPVGDNDSLLQLVQVRDLLAGQGWFDLHQYRMGPEGGFVMHWSRLLDAPQAIAILAVSVVTGGRPFAEQVVQVLWPAMLFCLTLFFTLRAARSFGGRGALVPALIIGAAAYHFIGIYSPGSLDHHNVQLMLTMASLSLLLDAPARPFAALPSGVCAALTFAIGMESAPYAGTIGAVVALLFLADGARERLVARNFGLGFAGLSTFAFLATVPFQAWGQAQCDAFSVVHFVVAGLAGIGLAIIASADVLSGTRWRRILSLGLLAALLGAVVLLFFRQCLAAPYASLDPRLKELWLDHINEAQSLFSLLANEPARVPARYATPAVAIVVMALRLARGGWRREDTLVGALLSVAFLVSAWEVRGSTFSIAFAVIPLSAWVAKWRERAQAGSALGTALRLAAVWLVSINAVWTGAAAAASVALEAKTTPVVDGNVDKVCERKATFTPLGRMPGTTVLAVSNLGSPILAYTGHRVFAGPYHRNVTGNLLALDAFLGTADDAHRIASAHGAGLVAVCPGNPENIVLAQKAPHGFLAGLLRGTVPDWLEPVADSMKGPMQLYRVKQAG